MYHREKGDDLLKDDNRLKRIWVWSRSASGYDQEQLKKWSHFQVSKARVYDWELNAILWASGDKVSYEARIEYKDLIIADEKNFKTRIKAQIGAEKLLQDWIRKQWILLT